jgi:hypothetical protein
MPFPYFVARSNVKRGLPSPLHNLPMLFAAVIFWIYSVEKAGGEISAGF